MDDMERAWAEAKPPAGADVPVGRYVVEIEKIRKRMTKDGAHEMVVWYFRVCEGDYRDAVFTKVSAIKPGVAMDWLKKDLKTCGLEPETLGEMKAKLADLPGLRLEVRRVDGKNGVQTFINRIAGGADDAPY